MATAVYGRKKHMTQAFQDDGTLVGVTVIEVEPNLITASRTSEEDGYEAVQVGFGSARSSRVNKPHAGTFAKLDAPPRRHLKELRGVTGEVGEAIGADVFEVGDRVHVSATSKGRGFQGTVKRHGFGRGPVYHGSPCDMKGLPTTASSRIWTRLMPARIASVAIRPSSAFRTAVVISAAPSGCIMA